MEQQRVQTTAFVTLSAIPAIINMIRLAKLTVRQIAVNTEIVAYYHYMVQFLAIVESVWLAVILVIHKVVQCVWGTTALHVLVILSAHPHVVKIVHVR